MGPGALTQVTRLREMGAEVVGLTGTRMMRFDMLVRTSKLHMASSRRRRSGTSRIGSTLMRASTG